MRRCAADVAREDAAEPIEDAETRVAAFFADVHPLPATLDVLGINWTATAPRGDAQ